MKTAKPIRLLSASDIAQMAGVGPSTVSNWRQRYADFPQPVDGPGNRVRFREDKVRDWLAQRGKEIRDLTPTQTLWNVLSAWRGAAHPEDAAALVSDLIAWRYVADPTSAGFDANLPTTTQWPHLMDSELSFGVSEQIRAGMWAYEEDHPERRPLFNVLHELERVLEQTRRDPHLLGPLLKAVSDVDVAHLEGAFSSFQDRLTRSARRGYDESATSATLVDLMATVAQSIPGPVHDPVVGSGRMLMATAGRGTDRSPLTGQEIAHGACIQANQRALLAGHTDVQIRLGDVLLNDAFGPGLAQVVVMDPPYGMRWRDGEQLYLDPRLAYGTPPKSNLDTAWLQLAVWYLGSRGRAFVLQSVGTAFRGGAEVKIRTAMLQAGTIEAIIALPGGLASHTQIPLNLWVLARPGETSDPTRVLLIDHSRNQDIDSDAVATALQDWRTDQALPTVLPARACTVAEILADDANVDPRRWNSSTEDAPKVDAVRTAVEELHRAVATTREPLRLTAASLHGSNQVPKLVSLTDLEKAGSLTVLRGAEKSREKDYGTKGTPVVTGPWIRGQYESRTLDLRLLERDPLLTQPGDILLQTTGGLAARVDPEGGRLLASPSFYLLRLNGDVLRPEYLAEVLVSTQNRNQAQGASIQRVRLQDLKIPLLSREQQDRVAERLAEVCALQDAAHAILQAAAATRDNLVDAITAGTATVS